MQRNKIHSKSYQKRQNSDNVLFREYIFSLPDSQKIGIMKIIADACDVQLRTVQRWREFGPIRRSFKEIINNVTGETVFNLQNTKTHEVHNH
jgi:uncharacterized protein YaiE (UPF0345 family)